MRGLTIEAKIDLSTETCCNCGVLFAMTQEFKNKAMRDHRWFYCPNGHSQYYTGESDRDKAARLGRELEEQKARTARVNAEADQAWTLAATREKELKALKRRVTNGVCPCCKRSFANVQRHMQTKHPEQVVSS